MTHRYTPPRPDTTRVAAFPAGRRPRERQSGFSLVEILVTLVVLSLGLLGVLGLQVTGLQRNDGAYLRTQASLYAYDIADRMRANRNNALSGTYNLLMSDAAPSGTGIANVDRAEWFTDLGTLPGGDGSINVTNNMATIVVQWNDSRAGGSQTASVTVRTLL